MADHYQPRHLIKNAFVITHYNASPQKLDILIERNKIKQLAEKIEDKGAIIHNLDGYFVYPGFIEVISDYGIQKLTKGKKDGPQIDTKTKGAYSWNQAIMPEFNANENFIPDIEKSHALQKNGFTTVLSHRRDGIARGSGVLVSLGIERAHQAIIKEKASNHLSFSKGSSTQDYPSSLMGSIALLRQTYYNAQWYIQNDYKEPTNLSLKAWDELQHLPTIFEARSLFNILRATKIGREFNKTYIILGDGKEYQRIKAIKETSSTIIVPINFPKAYNLKNPLDANNIKLEDLKHWELAPFNPFYLENQNIPFIITAIGLEKKDDFLKNLRSAIKHGLSKEKALKALTYQPAKTLNVYDKIGSIDIGKFANFIVTDQPLFNDESKLYQNWANGIKYDIRELKAPNLDGRYQLSIEDNSYQLSIYKRGAKAKITINDSLEIKTNISLSDHLISLSFNTNNDSLNGYYSLQGWKDGLEFSGVGLGPSGKEINWRLQLDSLKMAPRKVVEDSISMIAKKGSVIYPFTSYGWTETPIQQRVIFKNATIWTNEKEGVISNCDLLIDHGKIVRIGKDLNDINAIIIDAKNKHLTSGIIDEHSHIAIRGGVNEYGQSSSAEVSIGNVIRPTDINIYRQLAGGVTAVQLLHGSANPIGGQSALIKLRWGALPDDMKIKNAPKFVKFALGENVKQSNWGDKHKIRYPQTRMGIEQIFHDYFIRAKAYKEEKKKRIDLELEVLSEILDNKRFITCHSYVQSEINMLIKLAERHNFKVNTFTHVLEGYKAVDQLKAHKAGASTFSDWWAYKYEVINAIPYNAAILNEAGIVTAINSDNAEMGRRLNQEAAKSIKYGGVSEEDAWKMITLNPAKILHLDDRMGSLKVGKDADIVLWSSNPLSIYSKVEQTYIDGIKYFDINENRKMEAWIKTERNRLIQKMLSQKNNDADTRKPLPPKEKFYHCDDREDYWLNNNYEELH